MKRLTFRQVKQIAEIVSKKYFIENHKIYYKVTDRKTMHNSNMGGRMASRVSGGLSDLIQYQMKLMLGVEMDYFSFNNSRGSTQVQINERMNYFFDVEYKIVELLCGFTLKERDGYYSRQAA